MFVLSFKNGNHDPTGKLEDDGATMLFIAEKQLLPILEPILERKQEPILERKQEPILNFSLDSLILIE